MGFSMRFRGINVSSHKTTLHYPRTGGRGARVGNLGAGGMGGDVLIQGDEHLTIGQFNATLRARSKQSFTDLEINTAEIKDFRKIYQSTRLNSFSWSSMVNV